MARYSNKSFNIDVDIDLDDIFDEITDDELLDEAKTRGLITATDASLSKTNNLKRKICDMLELQYTSSIDKIISELTINLNNE